MDDFTEEDLFRLGFRVGTDHGYDLFTVFRFAKLDTVDVVETLTKVLLDSIGVTGLTDNSNNFIIGQEIEPTEGSSFGFQVILEGFLDFI